MSGRLIILPKKSYCPWNPVNVERVLRDERLDRERLEKERELSEREDQRRRLDRLGGDIVGGDADGRRTTEASRRRPQRSGKDEGRAFLDQRGHVNLFPEAEDGVRGRTSVDVPSDGGGKGPASVAPVRLGGDEAKRRASGMVPFYLRPSSPSSAVPPSVSIGDGGNYRDDIGSIGRFGLRGADEITSRIMVDQFQRREKSRKRRMDPMERFTASSIVFARTPPPLTTGDASARSGSASGAAAVIDAGSDFGLKGLARTAPSLGARERSNMSDNRSSIQATENRGGRGKKTRLRKYHQRDDDKRKEEKRKRNRERRDDSSSNDSTSFREDDHDSSSSNSPNDSPRASSGHPRRRQRRRSEGGRKKKRSIRRGKHESHSLGRDPSGHRRGETEGVEKRRRGGRDEKIPLSGDEGNTQRRHRPSLDDTVTVEVVASSGGDDPLAELRRRRKSREATESERERRITQYAGGNAFEMRTFCDVEGKYQNQYNPLFSRR